MASKRETAEQWAPVLLVYLGMGSFLFCLVFWALTERIEPLLLGAGGTLMGLSQGLDAYKKATNGPPRTEEHHDELPRSTP